MSVAVYRMYIIYSMPYIYDYILIALIYIYVCVDRMRDG